MKKKIYLITKGGYEWNEPMAAFANKGKAEKFMEELQKSLRAEDAHPLDKMSNALITTIDYEDD